MSGDRVRIGLQELARSGDGDTVHVRASVGRFTGRLIMTSRDWYELQHGNGEFVIEQAHPMAGRQRAAGA